MNRIEIPCEHVIREISNFVDGEVPDGLYARITEHLSSCGRCHAILNGVKNVITLVADDKVFETPKGFGERIFNRLRAKS